jgi:hypothetical protein
MSKLLRVSLLLASVGGALPFAAVARAAQTTITISMASPPAAPRIQPPLVIGATPSAAFLYTIPATGHSPLTYSAAGMPAGLTLGSSSGRLLPDHGHRHQRDGPRDRDVDLDVRHDAPSDAPFGLE